MRKYFLHILRVLILAAIVGVIFYYVKLTPIPVTAASVTRGSVQAEVLGAGIVIAHTRATISPKIQGRIVALTVDQNDTVAKDQLLARLDDSDLREQQAIAKANVEAAHAALERAGADQKRAEAVRVRAKLEYDRQEQLRAKQVVPEATLDESRESFQVAQAEETRAAAATAEAQKQILAAERTLDYQNAKLADTNIYSPFAGLITRRDRDVGDIVVPGASIFQLISTKDIWVSAWVDESLMAAVKPGQTARIVFRSEPGKDYAGRVIRVSPDVDPETREFLVDVAPEQLPPRWAVGQRAEVFIATGRKDNVLRVPARMIRWREGKAGVTVDKGGKATWRNVELGIVGRQYVEVVKGLAENETVVVAGEAQAKKFQPGRRVVVTK
jgi:RND family efflux transporter MFP subunit